MKNVLYMDMKCGLIWLYIIRQVKSKTVTTKCHIFSLLIREYPKVMFLGHILVYTGSQMHHLPKNISFPGKQTKYKIHNENIASYLYCDRNTLKLTSE